MSKIMFAAAGIVVALSAAPAFAQGYGHSGYGHSGYSHSSYGHAPRHSYQPTYQKVEPVTTYETKEAYVWQKVKGYCKIEVTKYGYREFRRQVECKAGEYTKETKVIEKAEPAEPAAPAPEPAPAEPPQK